ncbi:MAG: AmmeMemoRadiSam system radical SAM enzyme [Opitutaceae bacterium]|jgi:pyruvate formate lyase activating enzyme
MNDAGANVRPSARHRALWWVSRSDGRLECLLCPRRCKLAEGQRGFCGARRREGGAIVLAAYGRISGLCVDPIEKKPLYHFHPGSRALSFGTAGCNLGCRFCQNWRLSRAVGGTAVDALPEVIASTARSEACRSVAFTYNDPVVFAEYAIDVARACRATGVKTVAVTAGYISGKARFEFFSAMDAANVDLKAFSDAFYRRMCAGRLQPVLDTLEHIRKETNVWLEVTTLLIPRENDSREELERAADWFVRTLGPDVPWHFTAFHPDYRLLDRDRTPVGTLAAAREIARARGIRYVYTGNVRDSGGSATCCPSCGAVLIRRDAFTVLENRLVGNCCPICRSAVAGVFDEAPSMHRTF